MWPSQRSGRQWRGRIGYFNQFSGGDGKKLKVTLTRASERMLPLDVGRSWGTTVTGSSEIDVADAGILRLRQLTANKVIFNGTGGLRSLQEDEATC